MSLPDTITCIEISQPGGPEVMTMATRPMPVPRPGEVLIEVAAAGVNGPDALQRAGKYPVPPGASDIMGLEVAGRIAAVGEGVQQWLPGDRVCALTPGGGYATYCLTRADHCLPIPKGLSLIEAAALPETFFTVWHNVFQRGQLHTGERFLVHGGSGGIGTTAIQLAVAFGATVLATAGSAEKCRVCTELGAQTAINYQEQDFVEVVRGVTNGEGVDVILDMVGGDYIARNLQCLAVEGRLVQIAFRKGSKAELNLGPLMLKRQMITGSTLRPQPDSSKARIARELLERVWPRIEQGQIKPVIHQTVALENAEQAHRLMEEGGHIGKLILEVARTAD